VLVEIFYFLRKYKGLILKSSLPLSLILFLGFAFLLAAYNLQIAAEKIESPFALEIFIKSEALAEEIDSLRSFLLFQPACERIETVSPEAAREKMAGILGEDPTAALGYNPLPMSLVFHPADNFRNRTYLEILKKQVEAFPIVEKSLFGGDWLRELERFNAIFLKITAAFLALVLTAYLLLLHLTLSHLWLKYQQTAGQLHLLGMSRFSLRFPVYIWALVASVFNLALTFFVLAISARLASRHLFAVKFFESREIVAIAIIFLAITLAFTLCKRMKIQSYA